MLISSSTSIRTSSNTSSSASTNTSLSTSSNISTNTSPNTSSSNNSSTSSRILVTCSNDPISSSSATFSGSYRFGLTSLRHIKLKINYYFSSNGIQHSSH